MHTPVKSENMLENPIGASTCIAGLAFAWPSGPSLKLSCVHARFGLTCMTKTQSFQIRMYVAGGASHSTISIL